MIGKLLCMIGWHNWTWKLSDVGFIDDSIPEIAKCGRCGVEYGHK